MVRSKCGRPDLAHSLCERAALRNSESSCVLAVKHLHGSQCFALSEWLVTSSACFGLLVAGYMCALRIDKRAPFHINWVEPTRPRILEPTGDAGKIESVKHGRVLSQGNL